MHDLQRQIRHIVFFHHRATLAVFAGICFSMLVFGLYLQHTVGLEPCPMCIVQRYALVLVGMGFLVGAAVPSKLVLWMALCWSGIVSSLGAMVAARQSWLQWNPPQEVSCGRDLYGMIASFPLERVLPMVFRGGGDCSKVDWTFMGATIANWSFLWFLFFALASAMMLFLRLRLDV